MSPPPPGNEPLYILLTRARDCEHRGDLDGALLHYHQALDLDAHCFEALQSAGILHARRGELEAARRLIGDACAARAGDAAAHFNLAKVLQGLRDYDAALAGYDRALALQPHFPEAFNNRGNTLKALQRYHEALDSYDRALTQRAGYANALQNRGALLILLHRYDEALADYDHLLTLQPQAAGGYFNRSILLGLVNRREEALADLERLVALAPDFPCALGERLHAQLRIGCWADYQPRLAELHVALSRRQLASAPFSLLGLPLPAALLRQNAEQYAKEKFPAAPRPLWRGEAYGHPRLRLGYFSADFHEHATAHLTVGLFEHHDRTRFEVYAYSFGAARGDAMRSRLEGAFDRFLDVTDQSAGEIAALARHHEIDIAIDLKGHTLESRPGIFAQRPAPLQLNWLGFPGTVGAPYMDYIVADPTVIPRSHVGCYSEKIAQLPNCYQPNDDTRAIAQQTPTRLELGLPAHGFVFCCFNNTFKITPDVFTLWMRLLEAVEGSVLWLLEDHPAVAVNLRREARRRGIDATRLIFAPRLPAAEHLARLRRADLFLDTLCYNAHTTASDALWAGLPLVTCRGKHFAGRVAASLLSAIGLPDLIASNAADYFELCRRLATEPAELARVRERLAAQRRRAPLFDTARFTRELEELYLALWQRHCQGLPPDHHLLSEDHEDHVPPRNQ